MTIRAALADHGPLEGSAFVAQLAAMVQASHDVIFSVDAAGLIVSWNPSAERTYGHRLEEAVGRSADIVFAPGRAAEDRELLAQVLSGRSVGSFDTERLRADGSCVPVSVNSSAMFDGGRVIGAAFVERDITERRLSEDERAALLLELERSNEDLEQFAYVASHDLSEPLRVVAGMVTLLADRYEGELDERAHDYIRRTVNAAARMRTLIDDLLAYSRAGRAPIEPTTVDTREIVAQAIESLAALIIERQARIDVGELPVLAGDPHLVGQVFQNLLANALKFSEGAPLVSITAQVRDRQWVFSIADRGIGIAPEHHERVQLLFKRLHTRTEFPGNGLGLAISKRIAERLGGRLWIEPRLGGGTIAAFSLPAHATQAP